MPLFSTAAFEIHLFQMSSLSTKAFELSGFQMSSLSTEAFELSGFQMPPLSTAAYELSIPFLSLISSCTGFLLYAQLPMTATTSLRNPL